MCVITSKLTTGRTACLYACALRALGLLMVLYYLFDGVIVVAEVAWIIVILTRLNSFDDESARQTIDFVYYFMVALSPQFALLCM